MTTKKLQLTRTKITGVIFKIEFIEKWQVLSPLERYKNDESFLLYHTNVSSQWILVHSLWSAC